MNGEIKQYLQGCEMRKLPVILIFDVGKTNKKLFLFDESYKIVHEETFQFEEAIDDDGFPCEDIVSLSSWISTSLARLLTDEEFAIQAINFSGYGASLVYVDQDLKPILPLYNYLKPYPDSLLKSFYKKYGGKQKFSLQTASPVLGSLNSGLQLYRVKKEKPEIFKKIKYAIHLPQYLSAIITKKAFSEITSIGCHTNMWDFHTNDYHSWIFQENIKSKLPPFIRSDECMKISLNNSSFWVGPGLHDSSAALIPYHAAFTDPFMLLSTGTWCISLNPFNNNPLNYNELQRDSLCYLSYEKKPIKASRLFAGYEHQQQTKKIAEYFGLPLEYFDGLDYIIKDPTRVTEADALFTERRLEEFSEGTEAYDELIIDIVARQLISTNLVLHNSPVKKIFIDGGFSKNKIYMHLMAAVFPKNEVYSAAIPQASALGAALAIHKHWNSKAIPSEIIKVEYYSNEVWN